MKKAVYCSITGSYDDIPQPVHIAPDWDYYLFVAPDSTLPDRLGVWKVRRMGFGLENTRMLSRFPKLQPHEVLPDYDWTLWIDGNITILDSSLTDMADVAIQSGAHEYYGVTHPLRDDVAEEALIVYRAKRCTFVQAFRALRFLYCKEKYPRHAGLLENNLILRHNTRQIREFDNLWWELLQKYPPRDQFTGGYCLAKCGITAGGLLPEGCNARNFPGLRYENHSTHIPPKTWWEKARMAIPRRFLAWYIKGL